MAFAATFVRIVPIKHSSRLPNRYHNFIIFCCCWTQFIDGQQNVTIRRFLSFLQQSHLSQHMKTHGIYPFKCNHCDEKFFQVSHLTQHMKTHEEFKFKCNVCFSAFNQESMLRKHMQKHIDDRWVRVSYKCHFSDRQLVTAFPEN